MSSTPITVANGLSMPDTSTEVISGIKNAIVPRLGCGDVCLLNDEGRGALDGSSRPLLVNLTVPSRCSPFATGSAVAILPSRGSLQFDEQFWKRETLHAEQG